MIGSGADMAGSGNTVQDSVSFARSKKETMTLILILAGITTVTIIASIVMIFDAQIEMVWWIPVLLLLALLPALLISGSMAWKARTDRGAQLRVSAQGIAIPSLTREPIINWDAILQLVTFEQYYRGTRQSVTLAVIAKDPAGLGLRQIRVLRAIYRWFYGTPLAYNLELLEGEPEDVVAAIRRFAPRTLLAESRLIASQTDNGPEDAEL